MNFCQSRQAKYCALLFPCSFRQNIVCFCFLAVLGKILHSCFLAVLGKVLYSSISWQFLAKYCILLFPGSFRQSIVVFCFLAVLLCFCSCNHFYTNLFGRRNVDGDSHTVLRGFHCTNKNKQKKERKRKKKKKKREREGGSKRIQHKNNINNLGTKNTSEWNPMLSS